MQKWEYIELSYYGGSSGSSSMPERKASVYFIPGYKVDLDGLRAHFANWEGVSFELEQSTGMLHAHVPAERLLAAFMAACDFLGSLGWETSSGGELPVLFKRPVSE